MAMNWNNIRFFMATARAGSLTLAARQMNTSLATLSRRLAALDEECGVVLFARTHAGYSLTRDGQALWKRCLSIEDAFTALEQSLPAAQADTFGLVQVATSANLANLVLLPALARLWATHPRIDVEFCTGVQPMALHGREADMAVRLSTPSTGNFKVRVVGRQAHALYASHALVADEASHAEIGIVGWPTDFSDLPIVRAAAAHRHWRKPRLRLNTLQGHVAAARAGLGLAYLPCFVGDLCPDLSRVDGPDGLLTQNIYLVLHNDATQTRRVRVVADFIIDTLRVTGPRLLGIRDE
ncbi:LysR family transcriptional regulator [Verminephrobacter aporrectodeae subsp. tuberculatae]|uniref:LysR family transcriptional regulator n=1 Tax=Verminephrobacter aporrectodeae TaxID=1110389 RepID=UPI0022446E6F|nr:LysR family transcriptional regulator [Verminephrobacter aporrectodeae]MCW8205740.1 LysR family transcriptional regulator [Verminephrobacter aporrectodeae subsp. tuberculatae]